MKIKKLIGHINPECEIQVVDHADDAKCFYIGDAFSYYCKLQKGFVYNHEVVSFDGFYENGPRIVIYVKEKDND